MAALTLEMGRVQAGNLADVKAMLTQLAYQTSKTVRDDQCDPFTRLASKAQGPCRATLETLAVIKNPPTVFARQANISSRRQVNNGPVTNGQLRARGGDYTFLQVEQLEVHGERLELGAADTSVGNDQALAPVGALHRSENP